MSKIIAIVIAVLIESFEYDQKWIKNVIQFSKKDWLSCYFKWFDPYYSKITGISYNIKEKLTLFVTFVPIFIVTYLTYFLVDQILSTIGCMIFSIVILVYVFCNLEVEDNKYGIISINSRIFAPIFWYTVLGPVMVVFYWFVSKTNNNNTFKPMANRVNEILLWLPARITGFIVALVGNFMTVLPIWISCITNVKLTSDDLLLKCAKAAVNGEENQIASLIKNSLVAWVILLFIIVIFYSITI